MSNKIKAFIAALLTIFIGLPAMFVAFVAIFNFFTVFVLLAIVCLFVYMVYCIWLDHFEWRGRHKK